MARITPNADATFLLLARQIPPTQPARAGRANGQTSLIKRENECQLHSKTHFFLTLSAFHALLLQGTSKGPHVFQRLCYLTPLAFAELQELARVDLLIVTSDLHSTAERVVGCAICQKVHDLRPNMLEHLEVWIGFQISGLTNGSSSPGSSSSCELCLALDESVELL